MNQEGNESESEIKFLGEETAEGFTEHQEEQNTVEDSTPTEEQSAEPTGTEGEGQIENDGGSEEQPTGESDGPDYAGWLKENTGYDDLDSLKAKLDIEQEEAQMEWVDPRMGELNKVLAENDVDIQTYFNVVNTDYEEADEVDVVEDYLYMMNPSYTDEMIDYEINKFSLLDNSDEEIQAMINDEDNPLTAQEADRITHEWNLLYVKAKDHMSEEKEKYMVDFGSESVKERYLEQARQQMSEQSEQNKELSEQWTSSVNQSLSDYQQETFKLGEGQEMPFKVTEEALQSMSDVMTNPDSLWQKYVKDGQTDMEAFRSDMLWLQQKDQIINFLVGQSKSAAKEEVIKGQSNMDFKKAPQNAQTGENKSLSQQAYDAYTKAMKDAGAL